MIIFRTGGPIAYTVTSVRSPRVSDTVLLQDFQRFFKEVGFSLCPEEKPFVTIDGRRTRESVCDVGAEALEGAISPRLPPIRDWDELNDLKEPVSVRLRFPDIEVLRYEYNDRFDSEEFKRATSVGVRLPENLRALYLTICERASEVDSINLKTLARIGDVMTLAIQLGRVAVEEMMLLLIACIGIDRVLPNIDPDDQDLINAVYPELAAIGSLVPRLRSLLGVPTQMGLVGAGARTPAAWFNIEDNLACWPILLKAILANGWDKNFTCLAELGQRCGLAMGDDISWAVTPKRERLLRFLKYGVQSSEELIDVMTLVPPPGYTVSRRISHKTGFKLVYRGTDPSGRDVVLKRYKPLRSLQPILERLGITIAEVTQKDSSTDWMLGLRHPHILPCSLVRNEKGDVFFIERFLEGTLDERKDLKPIECIDLLRDICEAVAYLHDKRIIHSDIKPDNIGMEGRNAVFLILALRVFTLLIRTQKTIRGL